MDKKKKTEQGFSLVELLIVMAIFSIMVVIPVKMLTQGDQRIMLSKHVREVVGELNRIRYNATTANRPYRLAIDVNAENNSQYSMVVEYMDDSGIWVKDVKRPAVTLSRKHLKSIDLEENGVTSPAVPCELGFNPQGLQVDDTGVPIVTQRSLIFSNDDVATGDKITVSISPFGGIRVTDNFSNS